jgi:hypothetical protein
MSAAGSIINDWIKRRFGGVTSDLLLAPDDAATIKQQLKPAFRRFNILAGILFAVLAAGIGGGLVWVRLALDGPSVNPILDERPRHVAIFLGMTGVVTSLIAVSFVEAWVKPRLAQRAGVGYDLYRCYYATTHGWTASRAMVIALIFGLPMPVGFFSAGWLLGDQVDERAIAHAGFPSRRLDPLNTITAIELYQAANNGLRGVIARPSLVVRFATADAWVYSPDARSSLARPREVADYLAARTSVQIVYGNLRP